MPPTASALARPASSRPPPGSACRSGKWECQWSPSFNRWEGSLRCRRGSEKQQAPHESGGASPFWRRGALSTWGAALATTEQNQQPAWPRQSSPRPWHPGPSLLPLPSPQHLGLKRHLRDKTCTRAHLRLLPHPSSRLCGPRFASCPAPRVCTQDLGLLEPRGHAMWQPGVTLSPEPPALSAPPLTFFLTSLGARNLTVSTPQLPLGDLFTAAHRGPRTATMGAVRSLDKTNSGFPPPDTALLAHCWPPSPSPGGARRQGPTGRVEGEAGPEFD